MGEFEPVRLLDDGQRRDPEVLLIASIAGTDCQLVFVH
jgi:hypothetical protein